MNKTKDKIQQVNDGICELLADQAKIMLISEDGMWAYRLNYTPSDLMNAICIFQHVASNIGIKRGRINEQTAELFGEALRKLVINMTGYDPRKIEEIESNKN